MRLFFAIILSAALGAATRAESDTNATRVDKEKASEGATADGGPLSENEKDANASRSVQDEVNALKAKVEQGKKGGVKVLGRGVIGIGENRAKNIPLIQRYDSDSSEIKKADVRTRSGGVFFRGEAVSDSPEDKDVKYVYVSRGAWIIKSFQPLIDRLAMEVLKEDRADLVADFVEVARSFSHLSLLIASDDGGPRMLRAIAAGIASHREAVSLMKLHWAGVGHENRKLLNRYIELTFLKGLKPDAMQIEAGAYGEIRYKPLKINEKILQLQESER